MTSDKERELPFHRARWSRQSLFHILLLALILASILLLLCLDYLNIERYPSTSVPLFYFERTWKGRMFYIFFIWIALVESIADWESITSSLSTNHFASFLSLAFASVPMIYVLSFNYLGLDNIVLEFGKLILRPEYSSGQQSFFVTEHWPLSVEHILFALLFFLAFVCVYGRRVLRFFPVSFSIIGGIGVFYMIDTIFPYSLSAPLQTIAIPTAACAAVLAQSLGYMVVLNLYWTNPAPQLMVIKTVDQRVSASIAWPCAGVQSLFIYLLVMLLFLRRSSMSDARKIVYFIAGAVGTFTVNVVRIVAYYVASLEVSPTMGSQIHDVYGELFFLGWLGLLFMSIFCIQRFRLVERIRNLKRRTLHRSSTVDAC